VLAIYKVGKSRLKELLSLRGMTQQELANKLHTTRSVINDIATNDVTNIRIQTAKNLAHVLNCDIEDLCEWTYEDSAEGESEA
jgi:DNA-binding Xre family transcriptional regulator